MRPLRVATGLLAASLALATSPRTTAREVEIRVDTAQQRQVMDGFGATTLSLVHNGPLGDPLTPELRKRAVEALYGEVKLNTGNIEIGFVRESVEEPPRWRTLGSQYMKTKVIDLAGPLGFENYVLAPTLWPPRSAPWLAQLRQSNRDRYLDQCADQVVEAAAYWRDHYGIVTPLIMPFNEPTSGNHQLRPGGAEDVVAIVARIGARLSERGFKQTKLLVPCEETIAKSLEVASAVLHEPAARPYVGVIGYHCYPYRSPYASGSRILRETARGEPLQAEIDIRHKLRDLAQRYHVRLWMTEVSHAGLPALSFDLLRARAIHIHDEMEYADASAFFAMNSMWDLITHRDHFHGRGGDAKNALFTEMDTVVLIDNEKDQVYITGTGRAIGHYARWIGQGAVRLTASSGDPLVLVSAFRDSARNRLILVIINNATEDAQLNVTLAGAAVGGKTAGEQSTEKGFWRPMEPADIGGNGKIRLTVPSLSVTSLAAGLAAF